MKKLIIVAVALFAAAGFAFAANDSLEVSGTIPQKLTVAVGTDVSIGELNVSGATVSLGNATIRSNIRAWTVRVTATKGTLTLHDGTKYDDTEQITYTYSFNAGGAAGEKLSAVTLSASAQVITFARKTTGGSSGEVFPMEIAYAAESAGPNTNWVQGTYKDVITVTVTAG